MKSYTSLSVVLAATLGLTATTAPVEIAYGQEADELEEVVVTGSRIRRDPLNLS
jgi:hypothetical protein